MDKLNFVLQSALKARGYSMTRQRQIVFEALQHHEPQTMASIVAACKGETDRASVYRAVALFERLGIVQRLQIGWKYKLELSDSFSHHHHHLSCLQCGQVIPIAENKRLERQLNELAQSHNFHPQGHQLEIHGLCEACQATSP